MKQTFESVHYSSARCFKHNYNFDRSLALLLRCIIQQRLFRPKQVFSYTEYYSSTGMRTYSSVKQCIKSHVQGQARCFQRAIREVKKRCTSTLFTPNTFTYMKCASHLQDSYLLSVPCAFLQFVSNIARPKVWARKYPNGHV